MCSNSFNVQSFIVGVHWDQWSVSGVSACKNWRMKSLGRAAQPGRSEREPHCFPAMAWQSHNNESKTYKYTCWHTSAPSGQCRRVGFLLTWKSLKGTNWTMSLEATSPLGDVSSLSSLSRNSIALKSAPPTPTMIMDMGRRDASTIAVRVRSISVITPSVRMSST